MDIAKFIIENTYVLNSKDAPAYLQSVNQSDPEFIHAILNPPQLSSPLFLVKSESKNLVLLADPDTTFARDYLPYFTENLDTYQNLLVVQLPRSQVKQLIKWNRSADLRPLLSRPILNPTSFTPKQETSPNIPVPMEFA